LFAVLQALRFLRASDTHNCSWVLFSDSRSALYSISNTQRPSYRSVVFEVYRHLFYFEGRVVLQWIPGHCGIDGNEVADRTAKMGHDNPKSTLSCLSFPEIAPVLRRLFLDYWRREWHSRVDASGKGQFLKNLLPAPCYRSSLSGAPRQTLCVLSRLRIGHVGVNAHLFRFNKADSPLCAS